MKANITITTNRAARRAAARGKALKTVSAFTALALSGALCAGCIMGAGPASSTGNSGSTSGTASASSESTVVAASGMVTLLDVSDQFSNRDLTQTADLTGATRITVVTGQDVTITEEGIYVISGSATDVTITIEAPDDAKVQLVLDGLAVTNTDMPVIYALTADKVFVTTLAGTTSTLQVTGTFAEGSAVIQSKSDLTLNGEGTLAITSSDKAVKCSDDLKVTGGTYTITAEDDGLAANESIRISGGTFTIKTGDDAVKAENDDDDTEGYIYISGGTFRIDSADDGIRATTFMVIDGGDITVTAAEGLEATYLQLNGGNITISASDDGINASAKSSAYTPTVEINGGNISVTMAAGDTDAIDSNGNLYITGGTLTISAQSPFDFDGQGVLSGGTVIVNGTEVTSLSNQMMGDPGGPGGGMGGWGNPGDMGQAPGGDGFGFGGPGGGGGRW